MSRRPSIHGGAVFPGFRSGRSRTAVARTAGLDVQADRCVLAWSDGERGVMPLPFRLLVTTSPDGACSLQVFDGHDSISLALTEIERVTLVDALSRRGA